MKQRKIAEKTNELEKDCLMLIEKYLNGFGTIGNLTTLAGKMYELDHLKNDGVEPPKIRLDHLKEDTFGLYFPYYQTVILSYHLLAQTLKDPRSFIQYFDTVGHEGAHHKQNIERITLQKQPHYQPTQSEVAKNLKISLTLNNSDVKPMLAFINHSMPSSLVERVENMSESEQEDFFQDVAFSYYLQKANEEDARVEAKKFVRRITLELLQNPNCNEKIREFLNSQLTQLTYLEYGEVENRENYKYAQELEEALSKLNISDFENIEKVIVSHGLSHPDANSQQNVQYVASSLMKAIHLTFADRSVQELEDSFIYNLEHGNAIANDVICYLLNQKFSPSEKDAFVERICSTLTSYDCNCNSFFPQSLNTLVSIIPTDKLISLTTDLLNQDRLQIAFHLSERLVDNAIMHDLNSQTSKPMLKVLNGILSHPILKPTVDKVEDKFCLSITSTAACGKEYREVMQNLLPAYFDYSDRMIERLKNYGPVVHVDHLFMIRKLNAILNGSGEDFLMLTPDMLSSYGKKRAEYCLEGLEKFNVWGSSSKDSSVYGFVYGEQFAGSLDERQELIDSAYKKL